MKLILIKYRERKGLGKIDFDPIERRVERCSKGESIMTHGAELRFAGRNQGSERGRRRDSTEEKKYDSSNLMVQSNPFLYAEILKKMNTQIYDGRRERERDGAAERWPPEERDDLRERRRR
jgi:hypothetical protein